MKTRIVLLLPILIVLAAVTGAVVYSRKGVAQGSGSIAPVVATEQTAWGEPHPSIELNAPDDVDPNKYVSRVYADVPKELVRNGGVVHLVVTQPEWSVYDSANHVAEGTDGVLLAAKGWDANGIIHLDRIFLNLHADSTQRRWNSFDVVVPPGTLWFGLIVKPGLNYGDNNWFDRVWVSAKEDLAFHQGAAPSMPEPRQFACSDRSHDVAGCAGTLRTGLRRAQ